MDKFTDQLNPRSGVCGCARRGAGSWEGRASPHGARQTSRAVPRSDFSPQPGLDASGTKTMAMAVEAFHPFTPCLRPEELPAHQKPAWIKESGTKYSH